MQHALTLLWTPPLLAEELEPDDPEVDALAAQVAVETAAHQHGFPHYVIQGDNFTRTLTLRNSFARRFSHLETTRRRSHNRQLSKDFTKTVFKVFAVFSKVSRDNQNPVY